MEALCRRRSLREMGVMFRRRRGWVSPRIWDSGRGVVPARAELPRARNHTGCRQGGGDLAFMLEGDPTLSRLAFHPQCDPVPPDLNLPSVVA